MDKQVAAALNEEGVVSARRRPFTYENVWLLAHSSDRDQSFQAMVITVSMGS